MHSSARAVETSVRESPVIASADPARGREEAYRTLLGLLAGNTGAIPPEFLTSHLLDASAGADWPVIRAAGEALLRRIRFAQADGLRIAAERAAADGSAGRCWFAVADGAALPFRAAAFDAIGHSDVLCCLDAKLAVLRDCRRAIRSDGRMVFTVISIAPGLSPADHARAVESGPRFVAAPAEYPALLRQAGWDVADRIDLTAEYAETARRLLREEEVRAAPLRELLGVAEYAERLAAHRAALRATEDGLLRRDLFGATPLHTT